MGAYDTLPGAYQAIQSWMRDHHREVLPGGAMWEEYVTPPDAPSERTRTDVYWPLKSVNAN